MKVRSYLVRDELNGKRALDFASEIASQSMQDVDGVELSMRYASGVDVAGLAVLVRMYSQLRSTGRGFAMTEVPDHIASQLAEIGVTHLIAATPKPKLRWMGIPSRRRAFA